MGTGQSVTETAAASGPIAATTVSDLTDIVAGYSSTGCHSSWLQIHAWGSSTLKNVSVGSSGPS